MNRGELEKNGSLLPYILAGRADVTLENERTGGRFTFRVSAPRKRTDAGGLVMDFEAAVRFVKVLTGPDNSTDYEFIGTVFDGERYVSSPKSRISADAPSSRAWRWFFERVSAGRDLPEELRVYHEGRCCRCGRKLTVPESVRTGFGPECRGKVGL